MAGCGGAEYDCDHPSGVDDRCIAVVYPEGTPAPAATLVAITPTLARLRRELRRCLAAPADGELDAIGASLLAAATTPDGTVQHGARARS